jgi:hypothetical protein
MKNSLKWWRNKPLISCELQAESDLGHQFTNVYIQCYEILLRKGEGVSWKSLVMFLSGYRTKDLVSG